MTPIERAARALEKVSLAPGSQSPSEWQDYLPQVRAVSAAIREPSEGITKAGQKAAVLALHRDGGYRMEDVWLAMIDALLADGK